MNAEKIATFVRQNDDFGFEMRVSAALRLAALDGHVDHGGTYIDHVTQKPRQFDFRIRVKRHRRSVFIAAECKNLSQEAPLIICGRRRIGKETGHDVIVAQRSHRADRTHSITQQAGSTFYRLDEFVGKSALRPGKNGESEVHERWAQALSSARDLLHDATKNETAHQTAFGVVLPLVVVPDGLLWHASYNDAGTLATDPSTTDHCAYFVNQLYEFEDANQNRPVRITHLHFVTLQGLQVFLRELGDSDTWENLIPDRLIAGFVA